MGIARQQPQRLKCDSGFKSNRERQVQRALQARGVATLGPSLPHQGGAGVLPGKGRVLEDPSDKRTLQYSKRPESGYVTPLRSS